MLPTNNEIKLVFLFIESSITKLKTSEVHFFAFIKWILRSVFSRNIKHWDLRLDVPTQVGWKQK